MKTHLSHHYTCMCLYKWSMHACFFLFSEIEKIKFTQSISKAFIWVIKKKYMKLLWKIQKMDRNYSLFWCAVWRCVKTHCFDDNTLKHNRHLNFLCTTESTAIGPWPLSGSKTSSNKAYFGWYSDFSIGCHQWLARNRQKNAGTCNILSFDIYTREQCAMINGHWIQLKSICNLIKQS